MFRIWKLNSCLFDGRVPYLGDWACHWRRVKCIEEQPAFRAKAEFIKICWTNLIFYSYDVCTVLLQSESIWLVRFSSFAPAKLGSLLLAGVMWPKLDFYFNFNKLNREGQWNEKTWIIGTILAIISSLLCDLRQVFWSCWSSVFDIEWE